MNNKLLNSSIKRNFILQQGFEAPQPEDCAPQYSALLFQPRVIGVVALFAMIFQSPVIFLVSSAILLWSLLLPRLNPFDAIYNFTLANKSGNVRLTLAPPPRRLAQGIAGVLMVAIGVLLLLEFNPAAYVIEGFLLIALVALNFGSFCLGSYLYHNFRGNTEFARRTLPWVKDKSVRAYSQ